MDSFLTDLKVGGERRNPLLTNVYKEHSKLQAVIASFGNKVDQMIDKQRTEYTLAYGHHMREVQKELYQLRYAVVVLLSFSCRMIRLSP